MDNYPVNEKSTDINDSLQAIRPFVEDLQKTVHNLKKKIEEEREEHRSIYAKIKEENLYLREQLNIKS
tara:strand:+ start:18636 stop:18839 length:204 start_codon:yes stop_codon:yes gene_type:complete